MTSQNIIYEILVIFSYVHHLKNKIIIFSKQLIAWQDLPPLIYNSLYTLIIPRVLISFFLISQKFYHKSLLTHFHSLFLCLNSGGQMVGALHVRGEIINLYNFFVHNILIYIMNKMT